VDDIDVAKIQIELKSIRYFNSINVMYIE